MTRALGSFEEILLTFLESTTKVVDEMKEKNKELEDIKETQLTKSHYARKTLNKWFMNKGHMPI